MLISHSTKKIENKNISISGSKSISNRVLSIKHLCKTDFEIVNLSNSDDTLKITNALTLNSHTIDIGNAGTCMRFLTALLSIEEGEWILTGSDRMKQRPIKLLADALIELGADIEYIENSGFPPIKIKGKKLDGGKISIPANISSQYISALMMIAPCLSQGLEIVLVGEVGSAPYIKMTAEIMQMFSADVTCFDNRVVVKHSDYKAIPFIVEPDWSSISYIYEIASIAEHANIHINNISNNSLQGDSIVVELFKKLGVATLFDNSGATIVKTSEVCNYFEFDFTDCPGPPAQTFAVTLCTKRIPFKLKGLKSLRIKETDRISALVNELAKFGYKLTIDEQDNIIWDGNIVKSTDNSIVEVETYHDHRMALAFAPLALLYPLKINNPSVIEKSYQNYWNDLQELGFSLN